VQLAIGTGIEFKVTGGRGERFVVDFKAPDHDGQAGKFDTATYSDVADAFTGSTDQSGFTIRDMTPVAPSFPVAASTITVSRVFYDGGGVFVSAFDATVAFGNVGTLRAHYEALRPQNVPTAYDDHYAARAGSVLRIAARGVLTNDRDPEGGQLTAQVWPGTTNVTLDADGSFVYRAPTTPRIDGFNYQAVDPTGRRSSPATVFIDVVG
jgi:hypothetical protein